MKIHHLESGIYFEITEDKGSFRLHDPTSRRTHFFKESYEAIWHSIEVIRNLSFDHLGSDHLLDIARRARIPASAVSPSLVSSLKKEKIIRTYYDQIFLKLLSFYRSKNEMFVVSNKNNFIIDHEVASLLRTSSGISLTIPSAYHQ